MQLVKMGKIVLTVKWNKCKIRLPEAVSKFIFKKIVHRIQLKIYR